MAIFEAIYKGIRVGVICGAALYLIGYVARLLGLW
jgi:hypothetical protein